MNEFVSKRADDFLEKITLIRFFPNLSCIIVSVLIYLLIDFGLFYLLVSTWAKGSKKDNKDQKNKIEGSKKKQIRIKKK